MSRMGFAFTLDSEYFGYAIQTIDTEDFNMPLLGHTESVYQDLMVFSLQALHD
jgi:hypothetical protein